jgi:bifunctional oligoribonuclease and PAP phosphatase NrnA
VKKILNNLIKELSQAQKIGLMTHINGDGDAFGSLLGLRNILEMLGKEVVIFSSEPLLGFMDYLVDEARYEPRDKYEEIDLLIMLDVSVEKRLTCPEIFREAKDNNVKTIVIDHHSEGDIYDLVDLAYRIVDISSASEMVFWISEEMGMRLDKVTAEFLLFGIETDTSFLQNPNTVNKTTYSAKSMLLKYGAKTKRIKESIKDGSSLDNLKFLGNVVGRAVMDQDTGIIATYITEADLKKFNIEPGSSSEIAGFLDQTKNAKIVLVAEQRDENHIKVSMRSNNSEANVAELAGFFGGGGHVKAAGFEIEGRLEEILKG